MIIHTRSYLAIAIDRVKDRSLPKRSSSWFIPIKAYS
jgi:hypothetical protein